LEDTASGLIDPSLHQRQKVLQALQQSFGFTYSVTLQRFDDLCGLRATCLGNRNQLLVSRFEILFGLLALTPSDPVQLLSRAPDAAVARAEDLFAQSVDLLGWEHLPRSPQESADDSNSITEQGAVGRMMDVRFDHQAIDPQLPCAGGF
jgi:hypothetical protein